MGETTNMYPNLNDQQQFRLNRINEIKDQLVAENRERELMSKRLSKYIASFEYSYKSLIVLSATSGGISIASFATVISAPVGITSVSFNFTFLITAGIVKIKITRNKRKKHNKVVMLAGSQLNSIENTISKALTDNEINHEDFTTVIDEERNYCELKKVLEW